MRVDIETGKSSIFTVGHRNPQGLAIDADGKVWSTEHGPQGGDELNLLTEHSDYGYPTHTYGTEYGSAIWPPGENASKTDRSIPPVFAWVPSIGISDLVPVTDPAFVRWKGDLLIASLRGRAIWRVRLVDAHVAYAEPIDVGERVRDIAAGKGEFVLWTDSGAIVRLRPAESLDEGSIVFALHCGGCHDDSEHRIGPSLKGLLERPIASAEGYGYSLALMKLKGRWTDERLDEFLTAPQSYSPGTKMSFAGIPDAKVRHQLIEYLHATP